MTKNKNKQKKKKNKMNEVIIPVNTLLSYVSRMPSIPWLSWQHLIAALILSMQLV